MRVPNFILGYALGFLSVMSCASFSYRYYVPTMPDNCYDNGQLLGKLGSNGWPDIPLVSCKPDSVNHGKCIMQPTSEFIAIKKDLEECHAALSDCERGPPPINSTMTRPL